MKFAALLRHSSEDLPELTELFRSYKQLKKRLKTLPQRCNTPAHQLSLQELRQREAIFVRAVLQNVQRFNDSFLDREEDAVIQLRTLEDAQVAARPERVQVRATMLLKFPRSPGTHLCCKCEAPMCKCRCITKILVMRQKRVFDSVAL